MEKKEFLEVLDELSEKMEPPRLTADEMRGMVDSDATIFNPTPEFSKLKVFDPLSFFDSDSAIGE